MVACPVRGTVFCIEIGVVQFKYIVFEKSRLEDYFKAFELSFSDILILIWICSWRHLLFYNEVPDIGTEEIQACGAVTRQRLFCSYLVVHCIFRLQQGIGYIFAKESGIEFQQGRKPCFFANRHVQAEVFCGGPVEARLGIERVIIVAEFTAVCVLGALNVVTCSNHKGKIVKNPEVIFYAQ